MNQIGSKLVGAVCRALIAWLILSTAVAAGEGRHADAVEVFYCTFKQDWDMNFDRWPDRWVRQTGVQYPHYVNIAIHDDESAVDGKCLKLDLDGAAAAVSSPQIRVMSRFSYVFEAQIKNENLKHSVVVISLEFADSTGRVLQTERSKPFGTTGSWQAVKFHDGQPIEIVDKAIDRVVVRLEVVRGSKGDLRGSVSLAGVWLARLPRISVSTDNPHNVYTELDGVEIRCELSGIRQKDPEIYFQLLDKTGKELESHHQPLDGRLIVDDAKHTAEITDGIGDGPIGYEGAARWSPKIPDYGFYRVVVKMLSSNTAGGAVGGQGKLESRDVYLAVVPPLTMPRQGEFGWTLPKGDSPLSFADLSRLLPQVGINWVKLPAWFDASNPRRGDEIIRFAELLGASNIEAVGIINEPPASSELAARSNHNMTIADVLSEEASAAWSTSLEPVMTRLSLRVRWWQLGGEYDTSFASVTALAKRIESLRTMLFRFGQDVRIGMNWTWESGNEISGKVPWDFEQLCLETRPTDEEFTELLSTSRNNTAQHWILVEPPKRESGAGQVEPAALAGRSNEFVRLLVAAKVHGAAGIFIADPFNDENGLMHANGMPAELLLPWRTTAAMLGGATYLGQMQLPGGSENRVFLRPDAQVVMVVWNSEPTREVLYLGEDVRHIDIDGKTIAAVREGREHAIDVGPMPSFVLGLHEAITRWRMALQFDSKQVPSIFAKPHPNSLRFKNFFPQGVGGTLKIVVPQQPAEVQASDDELPESLGFVSDRWTIEPPHGRFAIAAGESTELPFEIRLKNALYGKQPVRVDFEIQADEQYQFSVYTEMEIGTEDLRLAVRTHLDAEGTLIVEQLMTNSAKQLADFRCQLYANSKDHRRQRLQVYRLGPNLDRKVYRFPDGADLVGRQMLLEIEELNGPRVLKYQFVATAEAPPQSEAESSEESEAVETLPDSPGGDSFRQVVDKIKAE